MDELFEKLLNRTLSPYEFVDLVKSDSKYYSSSLKQIGLFHSSPYIRLCSAWALGELRNKSAFAVLQKQFLLEQETNVRANIVWALFKVDPNHIDSSLFNKFLHDVYFLIPLIALKNIQTSRMRGKIDFSILFNKFDNTLLKLELLRNIASFKISNDINSSLKKELYFSKDLSIQMELIHAIGATNQSDSVDTLIEYYNDHNNTLLKNEALAFQYVTAVLSLGQSKPYSTLLEIYKAFKGNLIRWKTIEALASAGGPRCVEVLKTIYEQETDSRLKEQAKIFIDLIPITTQ